MILQKNALQFFFLVFSAYSTRLLTSASQKRAYTNNFQLKYLLTNIRIRDGGGGGGVVMKHNCLFGN